MTESDLDQPVPDVVEQHTEAVPDAEGDDLDSLAECLPLEADPADAAEQAREVELGDDDYR